MAPMVRGPPPLQSRCAIRWLRAALVCSTCCWCTQSWSISTPSCVSDLPSSGAGASLFWTGQPKLRGLGAGLTARAHI